MPLQAQSAEAARAQARATEASQGAARVQQEMEVANTEVARLRESEGKLQELLATARQAGEEATRELGLAKVEADQARETLKAQQWEVQHRQVEAQRLKER